MKKLRLFFCGMVFLLVPLQKVKKINYSIIKDVKNTVSEVCSDTLKTDDTSVERGDRKAVFSFIFDDLNSSDKLVFSLFQRYDFVPDYALLGRNITSSSITKYIDYNKKGSSILSHSMTHRNMGDKSTLTDVELNYEISKIKLLLEENGLKPYGWVTPQSIMKDEYITKLKTVYAYAFTKGLTKRYNTTEDNLFELSRYGIESVMMNGGGIDEIKRDIDQAIENNLMIVFYAHSIPSKHQSKGGQSCFTEEHLEIILSYLKEKTDQGFCHVLPIDKAIYHYFDTSLGISTDDYKFQHKYGPLLIYPNPTDKKINIFNTSDTSLDLGYEVYNMLGQFILSGKLTDDLTVFNLKGEKGAYVIKFKDKEGKKKYQATIIKK